MAHLMVLSLASTLQVFPRFPILKPIDSFLVVVVVSMQEVDPHQFIQISSFLKVEYQLDNEVMKLLVHQPCHKQIEIKFYVYLHHL